MRLGLFKLLAPLALASAFGLPAAALAAPMGDFCWLTDKATLLKLSVTSTGSGQYSYVGVFDEGDSSAYAILGTAAFVNGVLEGSFSGSLSTPLVFKTGIFHVSFSPTYFATIEGIRQVYVRGGPTTASSDYRTHTASLTPCP